MHEKKKIKSVSEKSLKKYSLEDYVSDSVLDGKVEYTQDEASKVEYIFLSLIHISEPTRP